MGIPRELEPTGLYYYLQMRDFERKNEKNSRKKSIKLARHEKHELHQALLASEQTPFTLEPLQKKQTTRVSIDSFDELFSYLAGIDLTKLFLREATLDQIFTCSLMAGNFAWISLGHDGHYRYFTKAHSGVTIGLDLIDLIEIWQGIERTQAVKWLIENMGIKFMEGAWMNEQNQKYLLNLSMIHQQKRHMEEDCPALLEYLKPHLKILETLNVLGNINIKKQEFSLNGHNIFFASSSYIADFVGNCTASTTNKVINLFAVLGIIKKVPLEKVPPQLLHESRKISERRKLGNVISYYTVPPFLDVMDEANQRAEVLMRHQVYYHTLNKTKVAKMFGIAFANEVYVQEVQKNKKKTGLCPEGIEERVMEFISELVSQKGYVTKSMVVAKRIPGTTPNEREKGFLESLQALTEEGEYAYVRPTKDMKKAFKLKNSEYILIKKEN